jgi:hydroxyacylglutathione hydrolase
LLRSKLKKEWLKIPKLLKRFRKNKMAIMQVVRLVVGSLSANSYLVAGEKNLSIIDPGDDANFIQNEIAKLNILPDKIILTHGHFDHLLAAIELKLSFDIPIFMDKNDEFLLKRAEESAKYFTNVNLPAPVKADRYFKKTIVAGDNKFKIIKTPGHTPGSVCLYSEYEKIIFVGDLIFAGGGIGRYDFNYSNKGKLTESVEKILKLPRETVVYPGHGDSTTIGNFLKYYL